MMLLNWIKDTMPLLPDTTDQTRKRTSWSLNQARKRLLLMHNLNLPVDMEEEDIITNDRK